MESKEKALKIAKLLDNKKGWKIHILAVGEVSNLTDYFVICSAGSSVQSRAMCDEVTEKLETEDDTKTTHIEGYRDGNWIVLDYDDVMVHIFTDETREFYDIERLWNDVETLPFEETEN